MTLKRRRFLCAAAAVGVPASALLSPALAANRAASPASAPSARRPTASTKPAAQAAPKPAAPSPATPPSPTPMPVPSALYQVNIRQHSPEGSLQAVTADLPRIRALG
ncbi:MAG: hypothetical protein ACKOB5_02330, partial [Betaproteobacteria bacterium]